MKKCFTCLIFVLCFTYSLPLYAEDTSSLIEKLKDKEKAKEASEQLAHIGKPAVPALLRAIEYGTKYQKRYAVRALRNMGQTAEDTVPTLLKLVNVSDFETRVYAVEALANMVNQRSVILPVLETVRKNDSNKNVHKVAEEAVAKLTLPETEVSQLSSTEKIPKALPSLTQSIQTMDQTEQNRTNVMANEFHSRPAETLKSESEKGFFEKYGPRSSVPAWLGWMFIPALIFVMLSSMSHEETKTIRHYGSDYSFKGSSEVPTGRIIEGDPKTGVGCGILWIVGYLAYWIYHYFKN